MRQRAESRPLNENAERAVYESEILCYVLMTEQEAADGLRGLQQDLIALDESRLRNVERLWSDLEARIEEFRNLLDKPPKNESSRKKILSGMFST